MDGTYPEPAKGSISGDIKEGRFLEGAWPSTLGVGGSFKFEMTVGCQTFRGAWSVTWSTNVFPPDPWPAGGSGELPREWHGTRS